MIRLSGGQPLIPGKFRRPFGPDKIIARRAALEIKPGVVSIFGFGASLRYAACDGGARRFDNGKIDDYAFTTTSAIRRAGHE